jgi:hypothetical protein
MVVAHSHLQSSAVGHFRFVLGALRIYLEVATTGLHRMVMLTQQQQQQRARNITVEDDDNMWQSYLKQAGRILLILALWVVFCVANTKLQFWIWHYLAAHPDHNAEIQFVNCLEVAPLLFGAAFCMYYLYPPFYTWNYDGQASVNGNHSETLQTLL